MLSISCSAVSQTSKLRDKPVRDAETNQVPAGRREMRHGFVLRFPFDTQPLPGALFPSLQSPQAAAAAQIWESRVGPELQWSGQPQLSPDTPSLRGPVGGGRDSRKFHKRQEPRLAPTPTRPFGTAQEPPRRCPDNRGARQRQEGWDFRWVTRLGSATKDDGCGAPGGTFQNAR